MQDELRGQGHAQAGGHEAQHRDVVSVSKVTSGSKPATRDSASRWPRHRGQPAIQVSAARSASSTSGRSANGWSLGRTSMTGSVRTSITSSPARSSSPRPGSVPS
ncbi:hypothetical protein BJF81_06045 [Ornithinimicrobium sp. CNJ-824]|nr:hypothetical protein BJF81_06045 [Ornithinimicrobium sp. CNJ-824]